MSSLKRKLLVIILLAFFSLPALAQRAISTSLSFKKLAPAKSSSTYIYNPSVPRLGLQLGSGLLFGALGGVGGGLAGGFLGSNVHSSDDWAVLGYAFVGTYIGYTMGSALGIYIVANSDIFDASYGMILIGNFLGGGIAIAALNAGVEGMAAVTIALSAPILSGMIANYMSIKKRNRGMPSALLNIS